MNNGREPKTEEGKRMGKTERRKKKQKKRKREETRMERRERNKFRFRRRHTVDGKSCGLEFFKMVVFGMNLF